MAEHPYGLLSLLPPVMAITLAIATRRVVLSLLLGILTGTLVLAVYHPSEVWTGWAPLDIPIQAVASACRDHLWATLVNDEKQAVFVFTMLMGALVGVISHSGGMQGLVDLVARWAHNVRRGQLAGWLLGLFVFFDDYANTMLLGGTLRPLFDRLKISREKLAYVVDSTAAPVSGLALVSTWVAGEIGYVRDGLSQIPNVDWDAFTLFVRSIPYRFYVLWALLFVPMVAWMGRDLGPMLAAERKARQLSRQPAAAAHAAANARWYNAVLPIVTTVGAIVWLMHRSGVRSLAADGVAPAEQSLMRIFGNADAFMSLVWGSLIGLAAAIVLIRSQRLLSWEQVRTAAAAGAAHMLPALAILWLASAMSVMTGNSQPDNGQAAEAPREGEASAEPPGETSPEDEAPAEPADHPYQSQRLYTGEFLGGLLENNVPSWLLPTLVFVLAGAVAFATGTSWGTMGVLMPLTVGAVYRVLAAEGGPPGPNDPILLSSIGGVLAGAIFGDHCSPISDTTVLSSQACGCNHVEHVRTQLPYALLVGGMSVVVGTLPVALGAPVWLMLPLGLAGLAIVLAVAGKKID